MSGSNREPQPTDGPDYHAEHAAWRERNRARRGAVSTPNPTHIIAEAVRDGLYEHDAETIAAFVVSELSDAGYTIMPAESAWTLSRAQFLAFGTERMDSGDAEYSRGYNTAVDSFRDVLRVADVEGERP